MRMDSDELDMSMTKASEDNRKGVKLAGSSNKQTNFNDWMKKSIDTYNVKSGKNNQEVEVPGLNESSIGHVKEVETSKVMWPSASEFRGKKKDDDNIAWMSKTKEQRERELSAEMD